MKAKKLQNELKRLIEPGTIWFFSDENNFSWSSCSTPRTTYGLPTIYLVSWKANPLKLYCLQSETISTSFNSQLFSGHTTFSWYTWNGPQRHRKETCGTVDQKKNRDHSDHVASVPKRCAPPPLYFFLQKRILVTSLHNCSHNFIAVLILHCTGEHKTSATTFSSLHKSNNADTEKFAERSNNL